MRIRFDGLINVWGENFEMFSRLEEIDLSFTSVFDHEVKEIELVGNNGKVVYHQALEKPIQVSRGDRLQYQIRIVDGEMTGVLDVKSNDEVREGSEGEPTEDA